MPWYSEACASTFTTTFSSGVVTDPQIVSIQPRPRHRPRLQGRLHLGPPLQASPLGVNLAPPFQILVPKHVLGPHRPCPSFPHPWARFVLMPKLVLPQLHGGFWL